MSGGIKETLCISLFAQLSQYVSTSLGTMLQPLTYFLRQCLSQQISPSVYHLWWWRISWGALPALHLLLWQAPFCLCEMNKKPSGGEVLGINTLDWGRDLSVTRVRPCTTAVVSWGTIRAPCQRSQEGLCLHPQKRNSIFPHLTSYGL